MTSEEVKATVDAHIKRLQWETQTQSWSIDVEYETCGEPDWVAQVDRNLDYMRATITIDPARHEDEEGVLNSLRHELLHLLLAPFDLYADVTMQFYSKNDGERRAANRLWRNAVESSIVNLERMLDHGHKVNPFAKPAAPETAPG